MSFNIKFLIVLSFFWVLSGVIWAQSQVLRYQVSWMGIPAGRITIEIIPQGSTTYVRAKARTTGLVRLIFPFQSVWETWMGPDGYPLKTHIWRKRRNKVVVKEFFFDQEKGEVKRVQNGKIEIDKVGGRVYDELSAFIVSRKIPWKRPGEIKKMRIYAHKRAREATMQYIANEKIKTWCGWITAQKIKVEFGFESELVRRAKKALFWVNQGEVFEGEGDLPLGHLTAILANPRCKP